MFGWRMEEEAKLEFTITVNWRREDGSSRKEGKVLPKIFLVVPGRISQPRPGSFNTVARRPLFQYP
jgi:hypothetical protein